MSGERKEPGDLVFHQGLAHGMMRRSGLDASPGAPGEQAIVERCRHCPHPQSCAAWQLDHAQADGQVPGYCLNRDTFAET